MKGCWVDIVELQLKEIVCFKVEDDVIVFFVEVKGLQIVVEGILCKYEMSQEQVVYWLCYFVEEKGEDFDESIVIGLMDFFQIEGIGVVVDLQFCDIVFW